jgi:hypothetical protein
VGGKMEIIRTVTKKYKVIGVAIDTFTFNETFRRIRGKFRYKGAQCFRCFSKFKDGEKMSLLQFSNHPNRMACNQCATLCDKLLKEEKEGR